MLDLFNALEMHADQLHRAIGCTLALGHKGKAFLLGQIGHTPDHQARPLQMRGQNREILNIHRKEFQ